MPLTTLKMKSLLETLSFHCHQGQEMYQAQMDNIFGGKNEEIISTYALENLNCHLKYNIHKF